MNELKVYELLKQISSQTISIQKASKKLQIQPEQLNEIIKKLEELNLITREKGGKITLIETPPEVYKITTEKEKVKILLISDTNLGGNKERLDYLKYAYKYADYKLVDYIFHLGDLFDSYNSKYYHTSKEKIIEDMLNHTIRHYPKRKIPTFIIAGDQDCYYKSGTIINELLSQRKDLIYLGENEAKVKINDINIHFFHKLAQNLSLEQAQQLYLEKNSPNLLITSHIHRASRKIINNINCVSIANLDNNPKKQPIITTININLINQYDPNQTEVFFEYLNNEYHQKRIKKLK